MRVVSVPVSKLVRMQNTGSVEKNECRECQSSEEAPIIANSQR